MKIVILCLFFGSILTVRSQCGTIQFDGVIPAPVYDTTHAFLNLHVSCNEMISLMDQNVTIVGSNIMVDAYYCYGWLQVITTTNDSIPLGVLPAGTYTYSVNVYSSYSPVTNCMAFSSSDYTSGNFTVLPIVNGLEEEQETTFKVYPNPATTILTIGSERVLEFVEIHDVNGHLMFSVSPYSHDTVIDLNGFSKGVYFVHFTSDGSNHVKRIIIQ